MDNLFLIVGLGNPGRDYSRTRHNAGFMLAEMLAQRWRSGWSEHRKFNSLTASGMRNGKRLVLVRPQTYMNASGEAVRAAADFYKVPPERIMVLVDDADLPLGEIRLRPKGGTGGHHGLESVAQHVGSLEFPRLRMGIGRTVPHVREITGHVLGAFGKDECLVLEKMLQRAASQIECWLDESLEKAMSLYNGAVEPAKSEAE